MQEEIKEIRNMIKTLREDIDEADGTLCDVSSNANDTKNSADEASEELDKARSSLIDLERYMENFEVTGDQCIFMSVNLEWSVFNESVEEKDLCPHYDNYAGQNFCGECGVNLSTRSKYTSIFKDMGFVLLPGYQDAYIGEYEDALFILIKEDERALLMCKADEHNFKYTTTHSVAAEVYRLLDSEGLNPDYHTDSAVTVTLGDKLDKDIDKFLEERD